MKLLRTWGGRSKFEYDGSVITGTNIHYGNGFKISISSEQYFQLLDQFRGKSVNIGTSRTNVPIGSIGEWLKENVTKIAIASYIGAILIHEGYATKVDGRPIIEFEKEYPHETNSVIDSYELIKNIKWKPSTGEIELEPIPAGSKVNVIAKGYFVTDQQGKLLVKRKEEVQVFANLLNHAWEIWVKPEIEKREKSGVPSPFPLKKFIVLFDTPEGNHPTIKFNDEYNLKASIRLRPNVAVKKDENVFFDMIADYGSIEPPTANSDPVAYFIFNRQDNQIAVYANFRPNYPDFDKSEWNKEHKWLATAHLQNILANQFGHLMLIIPELSRNDIPFTIGLVSVKMKALCRLIENDNNRNTLDEDISKIITNKNIISMFDNWITFEDLKNRNDIIAEVKKAFEHELYGCVVTLLMSQIEGIITDKLVHNDMGLYDNGKAKRWEVRRKEFDDLVRNKYDVGPLTLTILDNLSFFLSESNLYKQKIWESSTDGLSRHGSLHGIDIGFNTRANAIRMILLYDALYWILLATFMSGKE